MTAKLAEVELCTLTNPDLHQFFADAGAIDLGARELILDDATVVNPALLGTAQN